MSYIPDLITTEIVGRSLITAATWIEDMLSRMLRYFRRQWYQYDDFERTDRLAVGTRPLIEAGMNPVRDSIHYANLSSWIGAYDWVYQQIPAKVRNEWRPGQTFPDRDPRRQDEPDWIPNPLPRRPPPQPPIEPPQFPGVFNDGPAEIRFPKIEAAARTLRSRGAITRGQWDAANDQFREQAFTVAGDLQTRTIERIRDVIADQVAAGTSLSGFIEELKTSFGTSPIGGGHLETVYRTNVQAAFRDGRETIMRDPIIDELFPYQKYVPIHDDRVRHEHKQLGELGLNGTGIYRRDDPFWDHYTPPWGFNCRCGVSPMTKEKAAAQGVREAQEWVRTGVPPETPEWRIQEIPFASVPGFGSRGLVVANA